MPSPEEKDRSLISSPQENLESPFLNENLFGDEPETVAEPHLETLQRESAFRYAFEEARAVRNEPEDLEEQIDEEEEWVDEEDFSRNEAEAQDEEALSEASMERPYDEETLDEEGEGEEEAFEATALDEESVISDEDWSEAQEEESDYPLEEAEYADEEEEYDDESFIDADEEEVDWASLESEKATGIPAGREEVAKVPLLKSHRGSGPDLILSWNDMAGQPQSVDVVVHLHGYSLRAGKLLNISRDIVPRSGLDWSDPENVDRTPGRSRPTLTLLPRGHFFGGKSGRGYSFPALVTETGLKQLIDFGLSHFARHIGATNVTLRRLIVTAHSGGAAALLRILRHNDPREVHVFDGMYQDPAELVRWAKARIDRDSKALEAGAESPERYMLEHGGALRVLFRPGSATERYSLTVNNALPAAIPSGSPLHRWYRIEQTSLSHLVIPRRYGWRLLANAAAELPAASAPRQARTKELEFEEEAPATVTFPSGESLRVLTGLPEAKDQDYWDPTGSGNPLLDTGPAQKNKKLSASFTVRELTTSGGVSADIARIDPKLVESLQRLRDHLGRGIRVTSGYRSWKRNKQVYAGRKNSDGTPKKPTLSQHCGGRAADITIAGMTGLEIGKAAIDACGPNIAVGLGNTFAHIDVRGHAVSWNYGGVKDAWVTEVKRYQQAKGGRRKPTAPGVARLCNTTDRAAGVVVKDRTALERELARLRERRDPDGSQSATDSSSGKLSLVFVSEGAKIGEIPEQLSGGNFLKVPRRQYRSLGDILLERQANVLLVTGHHWVNHGGRLGEIGAGGPGDSDNLYFHRGANTGPFPNVELLLMTGCYTLQTDRNIEFFTKIFPNAVIVGYEGSATLHDGWTFLSEFRDLFLVGDPSLSVAERSAAAAKGIGEQIRRSFATPPSDAYRRVNMPRLKRALRRRPAIFIPASGRTGTLHRFFWDLNSLTTSERAVRF